MGTTLNNKLAWVESLLAGSPAGQSTYFTVTINITQEHEVRVPVRVAFMSGVSSDPVVKVYPSSDGGANFDSDAMTSFSVTGIGKAGAASQKSITLPVGQYSISILTAYPTSQTVQVLTQQVLTAVVGS